MPIIHSPDWCARWALYRPGKVAIEEADTGRTATWEGLNRMGNALAHWLRDRHGIRQGDRVAVMSEYSIEYIALFVAAQKSGFILVPLNYRLTIPELAVLCTDATPALGLADTPWKDTITRLPGTWLTMDDVHAVVRDALRHPSPAFTVPECHADDPVFLLYTSGTTGIPKGAIYTRGMLEWNSINTALSLTVHEGSRTVNVMPPFHTGGWNVLLTPFLHHGAFTCLTKKFDAARTLDLLQEKRATLFMAVPTMLRMMAEAPGFDRASFPDLLYLIVGGESMPVPLIETWDRKGVAVRQGYGLTEVGPNLTSLHQDDAIRKKGSIGRPNFYVQTRICDAEGRDVAPGQRGELWLKGPMVTPGYWQNPADTQEAFRDGWFRTGDVVVEDEEQYLYIVDRLKNLFISGGENVYPAEVERVLLQHPDVAEAAVVAVADAQWGEVGYAFIRPAGPDRDATGILHFCRQNLAGYKVPKYVEFVDELPKSDTGKIHKRALQARATPTST